MLKINFQIIGKLIMAIKLRLIDISTIARVIYGLYN